MKDCVCGIECVFGLFSCSLPSPLYSGERRKTTSSQIETFGKTESIITVQRVFQQYFVIDPPVAKNIYCWYCINNFKNSGVYERERVEGD